MISDFHAAAHFGRQKRVLTIQCIDIRMDGAEILGDILLAADLGKEVIWVWRQLVEPAPPESICIPAEHRQNIAGGDCCSIPTGHGVEGCVQSCIARNFPQTENVLCAFPWSARTVLVF